MARMIGVQIEVENGASRFGVSVRAASVGRALRLVGAAYPGAGVRVMIPAGPELSFVSGREDRAVEAETTGSAA